jgi:hypothetical protein
MYIIQGRIRLKNVVLSADGDRTVYSVPNKVADNLEEYCMEFCNWLCTSTHAKKFRVEGGLCYNEADFIDYLNKWIFTNQQSKIIENLGWIDFECALPDKYKDCPQFNF